MRTPSDTKRPTKKVLRSGAPARTTKATKAGKVPAGKNPTKRGPNRAGVIVEIPSYRLGKVLIGGFFDPLIRARLKLLASMEKRTQEQLLGEAMEMLFAERVRRGGPAKD